MDETSGRTGLGDIEVTPLVFLQLLQLQKDGHDVTYNRNQLAIAFRNYMRGNEGEWTRAQIKDDQDLESLAVGHVAKNRLELEALEDKKGPKTGQALRLEKFLQAQGVAMPGGLPQKLRVDALTRAEKTERNIRYAEKGVGLALMANDILDIASGAEPTTAAMMVLAADSLLPNSGQIKDKGSELLLGTYESRAESRHEREVCLNGLSEIMEDGNKRSHRDTLNTLQANETDAASLVRLESLKTGGHKAEQLETALDRHETPVPEAAPPPHAKILSFAENSRILTLSLAQMALLDPPPQKPADLKSHPNYITNAPKPPSWTAQYVDNVKDGA